ncbi:hypothetical protein TREMEDRAFT_61431 [Tremella mesenterica DSM 1558]|uniref:uncharacterized protein n=1 Tax=Tremella mesenterica (strain ATCC 24925 / CBS 8224 / DSM 1558 / NBRC 9311 / NRRL Y-6157 / RJB 2259-6 / UBC 559-6) TaxID=578456 RepID=UPI0003F497C8|nr:uncharacterized protein TREMEDRAFT_61431 [Tremella mesenterica DSM 1558]EIW70920.1 hypothetical protein TREMEDRAFT_61431 [Tremella mesenterica DSM 1558]
MLFSLLFLTSILAFPLDMSLSDRSLVKRYTNVQIVSQRNGLCLAVSSPPTVGKVVNTISCDEEGWETRWDIQPGSTHVLLSGTEWALEEGGSGNHMNGNDLQIYGEVDTVGQKWFLTDDNRIAIENSGYCMDEGDNGPQTWECVTGNTNQGE